MPVAWQHRYNDIALPQFSRDAFFIEGRDILGQIANRSLGLF